MINCADHLDLTYQLVPKRQFLWRVGVDKYPVMLPTNLEAQ